jgi:FkbM family methyltransferase
MNDLFSAMRLSSYTTLLRAYRTAGISLDDMLDGGAGVGQTSKVMVAEAASDARCYAFEPFPGNHRFFDGIDARVKLMKVALADAAKTAAFQVSSIVAADSDWGKKGYAGYSSVGYLTARPRPDQMQIEVECMRADDVVPADRRVGFIKLDLQGGEMAALQGMPRLLGQTDLMWVEYTGQANLIEFLEDSGFLIFDTEYFGMGTIDDDIRREFDITRDDVMLSTGDTAWFGFKRRPWRNYAAEFAALKAERKIVQTDLVCVSRTKLANFCKALAHIAHQ